ncbi:hypothetical protein B0H17DRAFT_1333140 [Mycena rosella]|uniref:Uncharacterized protein n=1 Tax=Mycena rosella TaxID=1033263 RepID=A0AAD7GAP6_MYCRO|nr:hypothetical protein B0H17DRAFT_1333140 [Mycena rosella]
MDWNTPILVGKLLRYLHATPTSLSLSAVCVNDNTYAVGVDPVLGTPTEDVYSYQQAHAAWTPISFRCRARNTARPSRCVESTANHCPAHKIPRRKAHLLPQDAKVERPRSPRRVVHARLAVCSRPPRLGPRPAHARDLAPPALWRRASCLRVPRSPSADKVRALLPSHPDLRSRAAEPTSAA